MKIKAKQLVEGCILSKDILLSSSQPFMRKKTVITSELLEIINIFLIEEVEVEEKLVTGERFIPEDIPEEEKVEEQKVKKVLTFIDLYLEAVQKYKKAFEGWGSGNKIDILEIRNMFLPLFEKIVDQPSEVLSIHHYGTKEDYLYHHAVGVGVLSAFIAKKLELSQGEWIQAGLAGAMADSGMARIERSILKKAGPLNMDEYDKVKKHPIISYNMLKGLPGVTEQLLLGVLQHHEREDGSGYPLATKGKKIHLFSQIVAVADVYHAMASERYYRAKKSPYQVLEDISKDQFGKFNHIVVKAMMDNLLRFAIGTKVILSTNETGEIVFFDQKNPTRPMVKTESGEIINLATQLHLYIQEVLN